MLPHWKISFHTERQSIIWVILYKSRGCTLQLLNYKKTKEHRIIDLFRDSIYRKIHTHRSNQICIRFVWEICICRPTVKDHLSQLPLHIELLIPVVYLLELRSAYVTEARKKGREYQLYMHLVFLMWNDADFWSVWCQWLLQLANTNIQICKHQYNIGERRRVKQCSRAVGNIFPLWFGPLGVRRIGKIFEDMLQT